MFGSLKDMANSNQPTVKTIIVHQSKIDVVKFDGTNNFDRWRCKMMNVLTVLNLKDSLRFEKKPAKISEKNWDKMNRTVCDIIKSCLT